MEPVIDEKLVRYNNALSDLAKAKKYLVDTDYVDNKILEAMLNGEAEKVKEEYAEILAKRDETRKSIDGLKKEVDDAYEDLTHKNISDETDDL